MGENVVRALLAALGPWWALCLGLALLGALLRLPVVKGWLGEWRVRRWLRQLDVRRYRALHNLTVPRSDGGTTQIDHVLLSPYGVFVLETKNLRGWIFGGAHQAQWTQKLYRHSYRFQNPLRQNHAHCKALQQHLGLEAHQLHSVVVLVGDCTLKTPMPPQVTQGRACLDYIRSLTVQVWSMDEVVAMQQRLLDARLAPGWATHRAHVAHLRQRHGMAATARRPDGPCQPADTRAAVGAVVRAQGRGSANAPGPAPAPEPPVAAALPGCPRCGAALVARPLTQGVLAGHAFWGCTGFPACRHVQSTAPPAHGHWADGPPVVAPTA